MSARCDRCGRFDGHLTERVTQRATPYRGEESEALCTRCLRLAQRGWYECHESVTDRDGNEEPCERPAYDVRVDEDFGEPYPVCRKHTRPPFRVCNWGTWATPPRCATHGGTLTDESGWCDKAFEVTR